MRRSLAVGFLKRKSKLKVFEQGKELENHNSRRVIHTHTYIHTHILRQLYMKLETKFNLTIAFQTQRANGAHFETEITGTWYIWTKLF